MLNDSGDHDFPIDVPPEATVTGFPHLKKILFGIVSVPLLAYGSFHLRKKQAPVKTAVVIVKKVETIPTVVVPFEPKRENPLPDWTEVWKLVADHPKIVMPVVETFPDLPDNVFAKEQTPEIKPEPPVVVVKEEKRVEPPKPVVKPTPRLGDPLGGVQDSNNRWLQADIHNIIVSKKETPVLKSADSEMEAVAKFLTTQANPAEASYLRFFTFYAMPTDPSFTIGVNGVDTPISLRQAGLLTLSFVLNSTANIDRSQGNIVTPTMLPGSDTICYVNIQDFGWTADQWDRISRTDPYLVEPLVQHSAYNLARLAGGNMMFRGDWFIAHATDVQRQADAKISELIYYTLLFDKNVPTTAKEFRKALGVDLDAALKDNIDRRVIMEAGKSSVSIETGGNRKIQGIRTPYGYYWETFDTKNLDFFNNLELPDDQKDAGEIIASHKNGTQVYLLVDGQDKRVDFADNGLVEDTNPFGKKTTRPVDRRVRTATSCIVCHSNGINPLTNSIVESIQEGVQLNVLTHTQTDAYKGYEEFRKAREKYLRIDRKYVNNGINATIDADNRIYEQAVQAANGLIPSQNAYLYWSVRNWYDKPLDLKQAAVEAGVSPSEYVERTHGCISARVNRIVASDKFAIPRKYWESLEPAGDYAHSVLTIRLHTPELVKLALGSYNAHGGFTSVVSPIVSLPTQPFVKEENKPELVGPKQKSVIALVDTPILVTENGRELTLGVVKVGESIPYTSFDGQWYQVLSGDRVGFLRGSTVKEGP